MAGSYEIMKTMSTNLEHQVNQILKLDKSLLLLIAMSKVPITYCVREGNIEKQVEVTLHYQSDTLTAFYDDSTNYGKISLKIKVDMPQKSNCTEEQLISIGMQLSRLPFLQELTADASFGCLILGQDEKYYFEITKTGNVQQPPGIVRRQLKSGLLLDIRKQKRGFFSKILNK